MTTKSRASLGGFPRLEATMLSTLRRLKSRTLLAVAGAELASFFLSSVVPLQTTFDRAGFRTASAKSWGDTPGEVGLARAGTTGGPPPLVTENAESGDRSWLLHDPATNHEIEGYASTTSVNRGDTIDFYVNTRDSSYTVDVYRLGWYGGM